jgi:hypothetical protein
MGQILRLHCRRGYDGGGAERAGADQAEQAAAADSGAGFGGVASWQSNEVVISNLLPCSIQGLGEETTGITALVSSVAGPTGPAGVSLANVTES